MDKKLFERLKESMTQMNEIAEGSREPFRENTVTAVEVKAKQKSLQKMNQPQNPQ
jgi:putative transcriptional regulator